MSLIKGLKDISVTGLYNGDVLTFLVTTCTSKRYRVGAAGDIVLTRDTVGIEYPYMTNLERLKVFV